MLKNQQTNDFWPSEVPAPVAEAKGTALPYRFARLAPMGVGYEVSSHGDRRFSALFAKLKDGRTIEEAYQLDVKGYRVVGSNWRLGKGKPPHPSKQDLAGTDLWVSYKALWVQWARENPKEIRELQTKAAGKILTDRFAASSPISQARALAEILNEQVAGIPPPPHIDRLEFPANRLNRREAPVNKPAARGYIRAPIGLTESIPSSGMHQVIVQRDFVGLFIEYDGIMARPLRGVGGNELAAGDEVGAMCAPNQLATEVTGAMFQASPIGEAWLRCGPLKNNISVGDRLKTFTLLQKNKLAVADLQRRLDRGVKLVPGDFLVDAEAEQELEPMDEAMIAEEANTTEPDLLETPSRSSERTDGFA